MADENLQHEEERVKEPSAPQPFHSKEEKEELHRKSEYQPLNSDPCKLSSRSLGNGEDPMLGFLSLLAKVERPACANCDSRDVSPMFYCNTCCQAICAVCKENTHSAKMFSRHDITNVSPYSREPQRKCPVHCEVCIMFSPATESLLCINCFRDLSPDVRAQCLDLDTAYAQKCEKLQRRLKAVGELEMKIKEEGSAHRALLKELHRNAMREESTVHVFSKILQSAITQTEEMLIEAVKRELQTKEKNMEEKLRTLEMLHSNVQAYLSLSSAFISSASKFELLKLATGLLERLSAIGTIIQPAKISADCCSIASNFKSEFTQSLKALLQQGACIPELEDLDSKVRSCGLENQLNHGADVECQEKLNAPIDSGKVYEKCPLPFLGRSQSLLNIRLNLERNEAGGVKRVCRVIADQERTSADRSQRPNQLIVPSTVVREIREAKDLPMKTVSSPPHRSACKHNDAKSQSLPKQYARRKDDERDTVTSSRSRSMERVEGKSPKYDVSQVELFATIQSHKAVTSRGAKNLLVTSLVGLRKSDRIDDTKKESDGTHKYGTIPATKNQSGHVCVVQAMVHQDADTANCGKARPLIGDSTRNKRRAQMPAKHAWDQPIYDTPRRPTMLESQSSSIELTPEQARELIRAISAAQKLQGLEENNWSSGGSFSTNTTVAMPSTSPSQGKDATQDLKRSTMRRSDSFEGHEEAVQLLVDAVTELRQFCCTKGSCEHF